MIKLGYRQNYFSGSKGCSMILLMSDSKIIFNGPCMFDYNYVILPTNGGVLSVGSHIGFGSDTKIYCENNIEIGDYCRIPFGTTFMDSNCHYSIQTETMKVYNKKGFVKVGAYSWIGNTSTIMKGAVVPRGSIVASKSFVNINFEHEGEDIFLVGSPAKVIAKNVTRIHSLEMESKLNALFSNSSINFIQNVVFLRKQGVWKQ